jgi:hypothetical protein
MRMQIMFGALTIAVVGPALAQAPLVVHEWGTITTIHDAAGKPQGRLNRIATSEVLPDFVYRYEPESTRKNPNRSAGKSPLVPGRPDVTMRLETPVIYFYPPVGETIEPFDVIVKFHDGVLNEYYPNSEPNVWVDMERVVAKQRAGKVIPWNGDVLKNYVVSQLKWKGLTLSDSGTPPPTTSPIWLAPRAVRASSVVTPEGESERYLFYRGVAHLDALFQTRLEPTHLELDAPAHFEWLKADSVNIAHVWLADIHSDGKAAFREQADVELRADSVSVEVARLLRFAPGDFTVARAAALRESMRRQLIARGLFDDEAAAMLQTWKASYFQKPGLRIFYIVPSAWLDYFLPLQVSTPREVELTRVIVGRIDLK